MSVSYFTLSMFVKPFVGNFLVQGFVSAKSATEGDRQGSAAAAAIALRAEKVRLALGNADTLMCPRQKS